MKTLADFKRYAQVGAKFRRGFASAPDNVEIRTVCHVQSNAVCFGEPGSSRDSWAWVHWPKAADVEVKDGRLQYRYGTGMWLEPYSGD